MSNRRLSLHPAVVWRRVDPEQLQVRFPTGDHITIDRDAGDCERLLFEWRDIDHAVDSAPIDGALREELTTLLVRMNALVAFGSPIEEGAFRSAADFHARAVESKLSRSMRTRRGELRIEGQGVVADTVRLLVEKLDFPEAPTMAVFCADFEDREQFEDGNRLAFETGMPITFVRWAREQLIIGPLALSRAGPCYECFMHRLAASARYPEELHANMLPDRDRLGIRCDPMFRILIEFAVGRHLELISAGALHLARAGRIERWDPFSLGVVTSANISRVPGCGVCGRANRRDPLRAVRDLI
jgi:hypothetical protein